MTLLLAVLFASAGVLLVALALPLMRRRIAPNDWYGLRIEATFADEWVWYEANARSGRDLLVLGIVQFAVALILPVFAITRLPYAIVNVAVLLGGTLTYAFVGIRRANRLLKERRQRSQ